MSYISLAGRGWNLHWCTKAEKRLLNSQSICPHHLSWLLTSVCLFRNEQKGNRKYPKMPTNTQTSAWQRCFLIFLKIVINGNPKMSHRKFRKQSCLKVFFFFFWNLNPKFIWNQVGLLFFFRRVWSPTLITQSLSVGSGACHCAHDALKVPYVGLLDKLDSDTWVAGTDAVLEVWTFSKCSPASQTLLQLRYSVVPSV